MFFPAGGFGVTYQRILGVTCPSYVPMCPPGRSRFVHLGGAVAMQTFASSGRRGRAAGGLPGLLDKLGQNPAEITRVQERDRGAERPVPGPRVDQPAPGPADLRERRGHVRYRVPHVVHALAAPREELSDRGVV